MAKRHDITETDARKEILDRAARLQSKIPITEQERRENSRKMISHQQSIARFLLEKATTQIELDEKLHKQMHLLNRSLSKKIILAGLKFQARDIRFSAKEIEMAKAIGSKPLAELETELNRIQKKTRITNGKEILSHNIIWAFAHAIKIVGELKKATQLKKSNKSENRN